MTETKLSLRRLWKLYKAISMHHTHSQREFVLLQEAFYSGARGVLKRGCEAAAKRRAEEPALTGARAMSLVLPTIGQGDRFGPR